MQFENDPLNTCSRKALKAFCTVTTPNHSENYSNPSRLHRRGKKTTATLIAQVTRATHFLLLQIIIISSLLYFCIFIFHFFLTASFSLKPFGIKNQLPEWTESNRWSGYRTSQTQKKLFNLNDLATRGVQTIVFGLTRDMKSFYGLGNGCLTNVSVSGSPLKRKQFSV